MLSTMSLAKRNAIAGVTALAVMVGGTTPALAWGKNEQNFLAGIAATLLVQDLLRHAKRQQAPAYRAPVHRAPVYVPPVRYQPVSVYATPVGQAFNAYSDNEQRRIQSTLSAYGYYGGTIDGSFGPGTYNALALYATRTNRTELLNSRSGAFSLLDGLLF
jgi:hypothetical protein